MAAVARSMSLGQSMYIPNGSSLIAQTPVNPYRKRPIAPAPIAIPGAGHPPPSSAIHSLKDRPLISKKYCALPYAVTPQQTVSIQRRNARERNRVKQVNNGFANLRQHIPATVVTALTNGGRGPHKKLSKVDTLKVAVKYIRSLQRMLEEDIENNGSDTPATTSISSSHHKSDPQAMSPVSYYGSMSESASSSPAPSQLSEYSSYSSQPEIGIFKREPYDVYTSIPSAAPIIPSTPVIATTLLPSMTTFSTARITSTATYSQPMHHVYGKAPPLPPPVGFQHEELSPQNTDDEELLDAISWWQQQQ